MNRIVFSFPTPTWYGAGVLSGLPDQLRAMGVQRPLVVTDAGVARTEAYRALARVLGAEGEGRDWHRFDGVHPNPVEGDVRQAARMYLDRGCDGVIALGGGSPLDAGKAARLLVRRPELDFTTFYSDPQDWSGLAPLVAIPTTAGTGSEVGRSSVVTLEATGRKAVIFHPQLLARLVILDPELTVGLPPQLTAATGADALTHCVESFTCPGFHPMCDGIALEGIRMIAEALPRAVRDGKDLEARGWMLVAAAMGAVAFQKDLGAVHSLAHPLSTVCGMHHGLANALCLVTVMRFNAARVPGLYRRVGLAVGLDVMGADPATADARTIGWMEGFLRGLGLDTPLREHGVAEAQLEHLADEAWADACHRTNAVPVTREDLLGFYRRVW